jgi:hypothetical protein
MKSMYAVIDRDGFFRDATRVYSAHATKEAAIKAANKCRVSIPGNQPNQSYAMVIAMEGAAKGNIVFSDSIRRVYPVIW